MYCLRHPEFARAVELDVYLKVGLAQVQKEDARRRHRRWRVSTAVAAGVVLIVAFGLMRVRHGTEDALVAYRSLSDVPSRLLSAPRVPVALLRMREASGARSIVAPAGEGLLVANIAADMSPGPQGYSTQVDVESDARRESVTLDHLQADADGYVHVYIPVAPLIGHTLAVTVRPDPAAGAEALSFRLSIGTAATAAPHTP
jgi:hypothetical protein